MASEMPPIDGMDFAPLIPSESDAADVEQALPQRSPKRAFKAALVGVLVLALGSTVYGTIFRKGTVDATVGLSSFYLIKHTFKSEDDIGPWWEKTAKLLGDKDAFKAFGAATANVGFHNIAFLPTAKDGPFYCLWEAKAGKAQKDMQDWIDVGALSPASSLDNLVMPILPGAWHSADKLSFAPAESFFAVNGARRLAGTDKPSTFYLIKHTFKSEDAIGPWWEQTSKMLTDTDAVKTWMAAQIFAGFHNSYFLPTAIAGPFYCIWEAKEGKTKKDMQDFIDIVISSAVFKNRVMPIPLELTGGPPVKSEF